MKIGYARVSTTDQNLDMQLNELEKAGCEKIYKEKLSGKNTERPELQKLLSEIRKGDQVVVWKLDRIGRSIKNLIDIVDQFKIQGVDFISLHNQIDTSTPTGRFTFNLFAALAEFEREMIVERTMAGLQASKQKGIKAGRKPGLTPENLKAAKRAYRMKTKENYSITEIVEILKIGKSTLYRYLKYMESQEETAGVNPDI
jgi:DNA invertase Pin-like site-specific DNA recombinase